MPIAEHNRSLIVAGVLLFIAVTLSAYPGSARIVQRLDLVLYDLLLPLQAPSMSDQITVIAIDNHSVDVLGRWPWDRRLHGELIDRLRQMQARVVSLDVLFSEPQSESADLALAAAIRSTRVILPVAPYSIADQAPIGELLPTPDLAAAAAALGHVDLELDVDGLCRSIYLRGGLSDARWNALPLAMLNTASASAVSSATLSKDTPRTPGWKRELRQLIPFTRPTDSPRLLSYSEVLAGEIDPDSIAGKYVLVGVTATGLGDEISTPGALSHERMPGVLVNAQILNGLLQNKMISPVSTNARVLLSSALLITSALLVFLSPLRFNVLLAIFGVASVLTVAGILLSLQQLWFPPMATVLALLGLSALWTAWQYRREAELREDLLLRLDHLARYHQATGLPNQDMLEHHLRSMTPSVDGEVCALIVMHINWPGSATIVLDRPISNEILKTIRDRLIAIGSENDVVAHLSGDDFALLAKGFTSIEEAHSKAVHFLELVQQPLDCEGEPLLLVPQIGVSFWPHDTNDPAQLLSNAYTAMFNSRLDDNEPLSIYSADVSAELHVRSQLEQALVNALERGELELFYQPQASAVDGKILGVEALLRWNNPTLGWISPGAFIPVAEHVGLIPSIGSWVLAESCRQLQQWNNAGFNDLRLAINISPRQFHGQKLENDIRDVFQNTGVSPSCVEIEITESSLMRDINNAIQVMDTLKSSGLLLAIDDFGTGYSSLSSLRDFPLDRLKIDMTFVREIGQSKDAEEITLTIIAIARQLGLKVIAEGVETQQQADFLREHGCDELQGYLFARPMPAAQLSDLLAKSASGLVWY